MGYANMQAVMVEWPHLPGNQYKVLLRLASSSMDKPSKDDPAGHYYAGWEPLAMAMGRHPTQNGSTLESARRAVLRELSALVDAGAIYRVSEHARRGTQQTYALWTTLCTAVDNPPPKGGENRHLRVAKTATG